MNSTPSPNSDLTEICPLCKRMICLAKLTRANIDYIRNRVEFGRLKKVYSGPESYITTALVALKTVDWEDKAREIRKFLFDPSESDKILWFKKYASEEKIGDWLSSDDNSV